MSQRHTWLRNRARLSLERLEDRWTPAQFTVTNTNDTGVGSLRAAITQADNSPDASSTIQINVQGTVNLASSLPVLSKNITIIGPGHANFTVLGNNTFGIFTTAVGKTDSIQGLTIQNGDADYGGAVYNQATSLTLTDVYLWGNGANDGGGAVYNHTDATLVCNSCSFEDNNATLFGGSIENDGTMTLALGTVVTDSRAKWGGGIFNNIVANLTIQDNSSITYNSATYGGGIDNDGTLNMNGGSVSNNSASQNGGGIEDDSGTASFTNVKMDNNSATNNGGGFYIAAAGRINYTGGEIKGNTAATGTAGYIQNGGTWNPDATVQITGTIVTGP
jgi:hypothetical protein